jgi:hypothetical protein
VPTRFAALIADDRIGFEHEQAIAGERDIENRILLREDRPPFERQQRRSGILRRRRVGPIHGDHIARRASVDVGDARSLPKIRAARDIDMDGVGASVNDADASRSECGNQLRAQLDGVAAAAIVVAAGYIEADSIGRTDAGREFFDKFDQQTLRARRRLRKRSCHHRSCQEHRDSRDRATDSHARQG